LIRRTSVENPLWGAPRIHGEPLKLGFEIAQSSVAKCMVKRRGPHSQGWRPSCATTRRTLPPWTCSCAREKCSVRQVNMTISLAFLAPNLIKAAVEGRLPRGIGIERLRDPPTEWGRQFDALGLNPE
jgi:hypothetical protein